MAETPKNTLKQWFVTGAKPLQAQYWAWLDSYWHKSEAISINAIDGLGEILVNKVDADQLALYAKKDASNIDVPTWKTRLGVGELPPNIGTIDYTNSEGFSYVGNAYKKIENPNDGNVYVLNIDGTKVNANTFGKNITNSSNTTNGSYVQEQRVGDTWSWDTNGQSYAIKNLPNKSSDASFVDFVGKNKQGEFAKVGFPALNNLVSGLSAQQALTISQLLNGSTGGGGEMSVNLVSPPIIQNQYDTVEYVLLRGANLNLNPTAMSIQILAADKSTVIATIPNNQIQLYASGLELVFYYNFLNFPFGTYFIKITSGVKTYITTLDLKVVESIENIDLAEITWDMIYDDSVTDYSSDFAQGATVSVKTPFGASATPKIGIKSSEIFEEGSNFFVEMTVSFSRMTNNTEDKNISTVGIGYSNSLNGLVNRALVYTSFRDAFTGGVGVSNNEKESETGMPTPFTLKITITKTGNIFKLIHGSTLVTTTLTNNSGYSFFMSILGRDNSVLPTITIQIIRAFKFN